MPEENVSIPTQLNGKGFQISLPKSIALRMKSNDPQAMEFAHKASRDAYNQKFASSEGPLLVPPPAPINAQNMKGTPEFEHNAKIQKMYPEMTKEAKGPVLGPDSAMAMGAGQGIEALIKYGAKAIPPLVTSIGTGIGSKKLARSLGAGETLSNVAGLAGGIAGGVGSNLIGSRIAAMAPESLPPNVRFLRDLFTPPESLPPQVEKFKGPADELAGGVNVPVKPPIRGVPDRIDLNKLTESSLGPVIPHPPNLTAGKLGHEDITWPARGMEPAEFQSSGTPRTPIPPESVKPYGQGKLSDISPENTWPPKPSAGQEPIAPEMAGTETPKKVLPPIRWDKAARPKVETQQVDPALKSSKETLPKTKELTPEPDDETIRRGGDPNYKPPTPSVSRPKLQTQDKQDTGNWHEVEPSPQDKEINRKVQEDMDKDQTEHRTEKLKDVVGKYSSPKVDKPSISQDRGPVKPVLAPKGTQNHTVPSRPDRKSVV
jgi:hypothetical protein